MPHWPVAQEDLGTDDGLGVAVLFFQATPGRLRAGSADGASGHPVLWATEASVRGGLEGRWSEKLLRLYADRNWQLLSEWSVV